MLAVSRMSCSTLTTKFTLMPVSFVKFAAVSFCSSSIGGLLTINTLIECVPLLLLPPPPAPQAARPVAIVSTEAVTATVRVLLLICTTALPLVTRSVRSELAGCPRGTQYGFRASA